MKKLLSFMILMLIVSVSFAQLDSNNPYTRNQSDARYERYLGKPSVNGYVLSSTTSGVRTWIAPSSGGSMVYPAGSGIPIVLSGSSWTTTITDNHLNWDKYNQWDGGSTGLTAATGRTSLGGTTIGQSIFTMTNPSAITFLQVNANNTASLLSASAFRTAIGAGTSSTSGTVTSVALSVPTGLSISGSPITASGTLALTLTSGYIIPSTASITNATTAYGWGNWASNFGTTTGTITQGNDSRLSDARTPTAHNQAQSTITVLPDSLISKYTRSQSDRRYVKVADMQDPVPLIYSTVATAQINAQTASYTATISDLGKEVTMNSASATTFTIPLFSSVAFPVGAIINITRLGAGDVTIAITATGTLQSENSYVKIGAQYTSVSLLKLATNTWIIRGRLKA